MEVQEILKMNGVRARNTVRELDDRAVLKELLNGDNRAIVRRAVEARLERLDEEEVEEVEEVSEEAEETAEAAEDTSEDAAVEAKPAKAKKTRKKRTAKAKTPKVKRINIQDGVPDGERKCPKCLTVGPVETLFGMRTMKYKTKDGEKSRSVPQSYCRPCRAAQRKK